jgi:hypothetical protein
MKRKALLALAAAAAVAAVVVLTTTAFGGTGARSDQPGDGFATFISCLASHGVQVPSDDPAALKQWLGQRSQDDPVVQAALDACAGADGTGRAKERNGTEPGPTPAELLACLERHRVDVPSGVKEAPDTLKQWLVGVMDQPSVSSAVEDCTGGPPPNGQKKGKAGNGVAPAAPSRPCRSHIARDGGALRSDTGGSPQLPRIRAS